MRKVVAVRFTSRKNNWETGEVKAELSQEVKRESSGLKTNVKVAIHIEGNITQEQKNELLKQADACFRHRQILGEWNIEHATDLNK